MADVAGLGDGLGPIAAITPTNGDLVDLLETRIRELLERYRGARNLVEDLRTKTREGERRIGELEERIRVLDRSRGEAYQRIDAVISEIEQLELAAESSSAKGTSR
ncbi:MAG: hypothetical protein V3T14_00345 [Myxococcota bacterium]